MKTFGLPQLRAWLKEGKRAPVTCIVAQSAGERRRFFDLLLGKDRPLFFEGSAIDVRRFLLELRTPPLLAERKFLAIDQLELLPERVRDVLVTCAKESHEGFVLLMGTSQVSHCKHFGDKIAVFDLSREKPWTKAEFLAGHLCAAARKQLEPRAERALFDRVGFDLASIEREIQKLIAYVGERAQITEADIAAVCVAGTRKNLYKYAEALVWEGKPVPPIAQANDVYALFVLVRAQLHLGLNCALLFAQGKGEHEIRAQLGIQSRTNVSRARKGPLPFVAALQALFALEYSAKRATFSLGILADVLSAKLA